MSLPSHPCSFQVYDADGYARSHYHLLQRSSSPSSPGNATTLGSNATSSSSVVGAVPGMPGRWSLAADPSGLSSYARMVHRLDAMCQVYTIYYFLQVRTCEGREPTQRPLILHTPVSHG